MKNNTKSGNKKNKLETKRALFKGEITVAQLRLSVVALAESDKYCDIES